MATMEGRRSWRSSFHADAVLRWLMPAPAVLVLVAFTVVPLVRTIIFSFNEIKYGREGTWIGVGNYEQLYDDKIFHIAVQNTATFTVLAVFFEVALGYALALLLYGEVSRWRSVFRTLFLLPMILSPVVVGITWRALLNPTFGWFNQIFGIEGTQWLSDPERALYVLIAVDVWQWTPFMFLMILAGLQGLSTEVLDAARVDGANALQLFTRIIWPLMWPVTAIAILLRAIDAIKIFDLVFNLTIGGPGSATETLSFYLYRVAFRQFNQGYAAAASIALAISVGILVSIYLRFARRTVGG